MNPFSSTASFSNVPARVRRLPFCSCDIAAVSLLLAVFLILNLPLLADRASEHWDDDTFFTPFYHHVASLIQGGRLLRWNPFSNGGSPDFAEPQLGASSPVTLLFGLLAGPGPLGFHLYWLGMWFFGGLGMYTLARSLSAPPWGALVSALGFTLSGFYIGHAEHMSVVYTFSFVPWIVWRLRTAMSTGWSLPACEAGALWGLAGLAGNPAVHLPAALYIGLIAPAFLPALPTDLPAWRRAARTYFFAMLLFAVVGAAVVSPAYVAFRHEALGYSHRALPLPREQVLFQGFGFAWLTALFTPAFVPMAERLPAWADFDISMRPIYCGAPGMVLAAFAVWRRRAWREWTIAAVGLLCLGLAMGTTLPLRGWLYDLAPPMRFIRHAAMFRGFFVLSATMLAALGTKRIAAAGGRRLAIIAAGGAALAALSYLWVSAMLTDTMAAQTPRAAPWHLCLAWTGTLLACLATVREPRFRRGLPGLLVALAAVDLALAFQMSSDVVFERGHSMAAAAHQSPGPLDDLGAAGWDRDVDALKNENLYSRRPAFNDYTAMRNLIHEDWSSLPGMCEFVTGPQRVWFAAQAPTVPPTMAAYREFRRHADLLGVLPVVRHERGDLLRTAADESALSTATIAAIDAAPPVEPIENKVLAYHANDLTLRVVCPKNGFVLVTERWARSWKATVNGRDVLVEGGDFLFRLVPVQAGVNLIAMRYDVAWVDWLLALSWGTLVAVAGAGVFQIVCRASVPLAGRLQQAGTLALQ